MVSTLSRRLVVVAVAAALSAVAAASAVTAAKPRLTVQPPATLSSPVGTARVFRVVAAGTPPLAYRWEVRRPGAAGSWTSAGSAKPTLSRTTPCAGGGGATEVRVVVSNAVGTVASRPTRWTATLPPPTLLWGPPAVRTVPPGAVMGMAWRVSRGGGGGGAGRVEVALRTGGGGAVRGAAVTAAASAAARIIRTSVRAPTGGAARTYYVAARTVCGGKGGVRSATVVLGRTRVVGGGRSGAGGGVGGGGGPSTTGVATAVAAGCPPWVRATVVDYDGRLLNNGDRFSTPTCVACRRACAAARGCDTWVWGADRRNGQRYRQCWLKAAYGGPAAARRRKPGNKGTWVSGVLV